MFVVGASGKRAARNFGNSELLHPIIIHTAPALSVTIIRVLALLLLFALLPICKPLCICTNITFNRLLHRYSRYLFR